VAVKRITVRVPPKLHKRVAQAARLRHVSLNQFVAEALEASTRRQASAGGPWKLRELSALLIPAAEARGLTEAELLRHARQVRRTIWKERYQEAIQAVKSNAR
jgi:predicted transcriptional regulator